MMFFVPYHPFHPIPTYSERTCFHTIAAVERVLLRVFNPSLQLYHLQKRILTNVNFFTLNYVVVALAILALEMLFQFSPLIA